MPYPPDFNSFAADRSQASKHLRLSEVEALNRIDSIIEKLADLSGWLTDSDQEAQVDEAMRAMKYLKGEIEGSW